MFTPVGEGARIPRRKRVRRARRLLAGTLVLSLVGGVGFAVWRLAFVTGTDRVQACRKPTAATPTARPVVALQPRQVAVNVYNATTIPGLAGRTARELKRRGFAVGKVGNDPLERHVAGVAEIRSGTTATRQVVLVQAHVPGATTVRDRRTDATVDLVLGNAFRRLGSATQVQSALSPAPAPSATATTRGC